MSVSLEKKFSVYDFIYFLDMNVDTNDLYCKTLNESELKRLIRVNLRKFIKEAL